MVTFGAADIVADAERDLRREGDGFGTSFASFAVQARRLFIEQGLEGVLICWNERRGEILRDGVLSINIPRWWEEKSSWQFHLSRIVYGIKLAVYAKKKPC